MPLAHPSQKVGYPYFVVALLLFVLQVLVGTWLAVNYWASLPQWLVDVFPFSTARAIHTNLLVLWLLLGFMGSTYYLVPDETGRELFSPGLAYLQLVILAGTGVVGIVGFLFGWTEGKPLLELPRPLDILIVIGALIFLVNVGMTMVRAGRWTAIQGSLLGGLVFLALLYLFDLPFYRNLTIDWYYWWWVIHLWVEGAWELVAAALTAWILIKITGVDRAVVEKLLYAELGLFLFTGIAGTGHHYYWLGAPRYWLWVGEIFSELEPLPIVLMLWDTWRHVKERQLPIRSRLVFTYTVGMAVLHLVGAGFWGFVHTLPQINYYTHGSQVTAAHGHIAFFGAYVLLNLTLLLLRDAGTAGHHPVRREARSHRLLVDEPVHAGYGPQLWRGGGPAGLYCAVQKIGDGSPTPAQSARRGSVDNAPGPGRAARLNPAWRHHPPLILPLPLAGERYGWGDSSRRRNTTKPAPSGHGAWGHTEVGVRPYFSISTQNKFLKA